jgi:glycosyltransferase involved in cell wall biosynthesis
VVHAHGSLYATTVLAARLSRSAGLPLVLTEHVGFVQYRGRLASTVESAAWNVLGDRVVAVAGSLTALNSRVVEWLGRRYPERQVHYIGNGVDSDAFRPRPEERAQLRRGLGLPERELLVLFVGRQSEKKNLEFVLAAPRRSFRLVVCGARRRLPADVIDLGILPHARMPELFSAVDLMVNPASGEGFPLAVQEAMASGLPVALLWDSGYAGSLDRGVPASCDTLAELGQALETLASNPEARADLSRRARLWAEERWSWEATASSYERLYEAALAGAKS